MKNFAMFYVRYVGFFLIMGIGMYYAFGFWAFAVPQPWGALSLLGAPVWAYAVLNLDMDPL